MMGVSLLSIFYPGSPALTNIWLYGGLVLFSAFIMYDTQKIVHSAKTKLKYDPIGQSISVYMDAVNLFIRFVMIFGNNRKNN
jgi:FtsH-binding integral membrane protein